MKRTLVGLVAALAMLSACTKAAYVADGPLARPLTQFNRIDVRAVANKVAPAPATSETPPPPAEKFIDSFRMDLTNRLHRKKVLHYSSGPMLILEASLLRYGCESRSKSYENDRLTSQGTIELEIVLSDESGKRIGGGKATMTAPGSTPELAMKEAQRKISAAVADYIKKSVRGNEPDPPGSDDP